MFAAGILTAVARPASDSTFLNFFMYSLTLLNVFHHYVTFLSFYNSFNFVLQLGQECVFAWGRERPGPRNLLSPSSCCACLYGGGEGEGGGGGGGGGGGQRNLGPFWVTFFFKIYITKFRLDF